MKKIGYLLWARYIKCYKITLWTKHTCFICLTFCSNIVQLISHDCVFMSVSVINDFLFANLSTFIKNASLVNTDTFVIQSFPHFHSFVCYFLHCTVELFVHFCAHQLFQPTCPNLSWHVGNTFSVSVFAVGSPNF